MEYPWYVRNTDNYIRPTNLSFTFAETELLSALLMIRGATEADISVQVHNSSLMLTSTKQVRVTGVVTAVSIICMYSDVRGNVTCGYNSKYE